MGKLTPFIGFFINGPHEGKFISLEKKLETIEIQFDETCMFRGYTEEDIRKGTYVQYNALGRDGNIIYYILGEQPDGLDHSGN